MAVLDNIKNENIKKIFLVVIPYVDSNDLTLKKLYFSDYFCTVREDITSGNLINAEERLDNIPSFVKEIDLIKNEVIVKSAYTLSIINNDEYMTGYFNSNYFFNQEVKIYVTTENDLATDLTVGEFLQIATANIKKVKIDSNTIKIDLDEINVFEKQISNFVELFNYENIKPELASKQKPKIIGKLNNYKLEQINYGSDDFKNNTGLTASLVFEPSVNLTRLTFSTLDEAFKFKNMIKNGSKVFVEDNTAGANYQPSALAFVAASLTDQKSIYLERSLQLNIITNKKVFLMEKNSTATNNTFLVSKNWDYNSDLPGHIKNTITSWSFAREIVVSDNWDFLKAGDILVLYLNTCGGLTEEVEVESYNSTTKTITIKRNTALLNIAVLRSDLSILTNISVNYLVIPSILVNNVNYVSRRKYIDITLDDINLFDTNAQSQQAQVKLTDSNLAVYTFDETETNFELGNKTSIQFTDTALSSPYTPTYTTSTNSKGGTKYSVNYRSGFTTKTQLITLLNTFIATSITGSGTIGVLPSTETFFTNGLYAGSYIVFNTATEGFIDDFITPCDSYYYNTMIVRFLVDSDTQMNSEISDLWSILNTERKITVNLLSTDTADDILVKTQNAINNHYANTANNYNAHGILAQVDFTNKVLRMQQISKTNQDITLNGFRKLNTTFRQYEIINTTVNDFKRTYVMQEFGGLAASTPELHLIVDKVGLTLASGQLTNTIYNLTTQGYTGTTNNQNYFQIDETLSKLESNYILYNILNYGFYLDANSTYKMQVINQVLRVFFKNDNTLKYFNHSPIQFRTDNFENNGLYKNFNALKMIEVTDVYVNYNNPLESNVADNINILLNEYGITDYSASDLTDLKANHRNFISYSILNENIEFYKQLNKLLLSFNINSFVDNNGVMRFKFFNTYDTTITKEIDYFDLKDSDFEIEDITINKVNYNILFDHKDSKYTEKFFTDATIDSINTTFSLGLNKTEKKDTQAMYDFFTESFSGQTYQNIFKRKFLRKNMYQSVMTDLTYIDLNIGDTVKITNHPIINYNSYIFKVYKIENNFETIKFSLLKIN